MEQNLKKLSNGEGSKKREDQSGKACVDAQGAVATRLVRATAAAARTRIA
jgi:hypothetical protein